MKNWFSGISFLVVILNLIIPAIPTPWDKLVAAVAGILSFYFLSNSTKAIARKLKGGPKMKSFMWLLLIPILFMVGCANQTWQMKATNVAIGGSYGIKIAGDTIKPPCDQAVISPENCSKLKVDYNIAVVAYRAAVSDLKLALTTTDAVQRDELLVQMDVILAQFKQATYDLIDLFQQIQAVQLKIQRPAKTLAISPAVIQIIISAVEAIVKIVPDIVSWVSNWTSAPDIATLIKQLDDAVASIPVWQ